jgi:hypothetical protein
MPVVVEEEGPVGRFFDKVSNLFHWSSTVA